MPELPEVQTFVNYLSKNIVNLSIKDISILMPKFLKNTNEKKFKKILINSKIKKISRIGKYIIFELNNNYFLVSHLRMEGKYFIDRNIMKRKHDYLIFYLSNKKYLTYNDSRQFGTFHLTNNLLNLDILNKIAIDPLNDNFNLNYFYPLVKDSKKNIKAILLDQSIVSGIGNIYASEILFKSKISPLKKGNDLDKKEILKIIQNAKKILLKAIQYNGTTIHSFSFGDGNTGSFSSFLKVYNRQGLPCFICKNKIVKLKQQTRSTYYCPKCQNN